MKWEHCPKVLLDETSWVKTKQEPNRFGVREKMLGSGDSIWQSESSADLAEYAKMALALRSKDRSLSVCMIGLGLGWLPRLCAGHFERPWTAIEISAGIADYFRQCHPGFPIDIKIGDWRTALAGKFDILIYEADEELTHSDRCRLSEHAETVYIYEVGASQYVLQKGFQMQEYHLGINDSIIILLKDGQTRVTLAGNGLGSILSNTLQISMSLGTGHPDGPLPDPDPQNHEVKLATAQDGVEVFVEGTAYVEHVTIRGDGDMTFHRSGGREPMIVSLNIP